VTRRRGDETRRRDGETTTATDDAQANDDQNGIEQATVGAQETLDSSNAGMTLTAMASKAVLSITAVSGFRNHRPQRVALFNFYEFVGTRFAVRIGAGR
jgi:hypothetical protein